LSRRARASQRSGARTGLDGEARPPGEFVLDGGGIEPASREQHVAVKPQVGELLDQAFVALGRPG